MAAAPLASPFGSPREPACIALVLRLEGGAAYTNNPKDRGGPTKYGVTLIALSEWRGRPCTAADVQALTEAEAQLIYDKYWDAVSGDNLPAGVDLMIFDAAVNTGRLRAAKLLQGVLGVVQDGVIGPKTLWALAAVGDRVGLVERIRLARVAYYQGLADYPTFGRGWLNRVATVANTAKAWAAKG